MADGIITKVTTQTAQNITLLTYHKKMTQKNRVKMAFKHFHKFSPDPKQFFNQICKFKKSEWTGINVL